MINTGKAGHRRDTPSLDAAEGMQAAGPASGSATLQAGNPVRYLAARLWERHRSGSVMAVSLGVLAAATEGIGLLLLLPLLAGLGLGTLPETLRSLPLLGGQASNLAVVVTLFLLLIVIRQLVVFLQRVSVVRTRLEFSQAIRIDLFSALSEARWEHFSSGNLYRQSQILTLDCHRAGDAAQHLFGLLAATIVATVQLGIAAWVSLPFALLIAGIGVLAGLLLRGRVRRLAGIGQQLSARNDAIFGLLANFLPMLRAARISGRGHDLASRFREKSESANRSIMKYVIEHTANTALIQLGAGILLCVSVVVWIRVFGLGGLQLTLLVLVFARLTPVFAQLHQYLQKLAHDLPAVRNAALNIAWWKSRADLGDGAVSMEQPRSSIGLAAVSGGYAGTDDREVLHEVSLELPVGRVAALTGPTGAGKSTLADILAGLMLPQSGHVTLDGRPLEPMAIGAWRRRVGYVDQDAIVFSGSIRDNLLFGVGEVAEDWLKTVLRATSVTEFVSRLPQGLDTQTGEQGARLSGGQRKRIAMARELLRRPWLLILDEATSGLDGATEAEVLRGIAALPDAPAVLLITHQQRTVEYAETVFRLENGRLMPDADRQAARTLPA